MKIVPAISRDAEILTSITKKSKAYWGYTDEQLANWADLLTITEIYIETNSVFNLLMKSEIVGYYSFVNSDKNTIKLDNLFVLPEFIGIGFGKLLMFDLFDRLRNSSIEKIVIESEPYAEKFYEKFGFIKVGQIETATPQRYLPVMELLLK